MITPQEVIENRAKFRQIITTRLSQFLSRDLEYYYDDGVIHLHDYDVAKHSDIFNEVLKEFEKNGWQFNVVKTAARFCETFELYFWPNNNEYSPPLEK